MEKSFTAKGETHGTKSAFTKHELLISSRDSGKPKIMTTKKKLTCSCSSQRKDGSGDMFLKGLFYVPFLPSSSLAAVSFHCPRLCAV